MNKKRILIRIVAILVLIAIGGVMLIIGRGHTVYFDNKKIEYNGETLDPMHKVEIVVNGEKVAKLAKKERGMATCMGQSFEADLIITKEKKGEETEQHMKLKLPYDMDGIVINLPAYLAGLPEEAWMSEFVSLATTSTDETEEEIVTDEFGLEGFEG